MPEYLLLDNGSKRPEASLRLRQLAADLARHSGRSVHPVSLQHADAIPAEALGGSPAQTFAPFLRRQCRQGQREFVGIPLFFGESRALTSFIPQQLEALREEFPDLSFELAPVTYPLPEGEPLLADILHAHIQQGRELLGESARVVLVDHGSPSPDITAVRQALAAELDRRYSLVPAQAVMERREGPEYDFNGPLLEDWLAQEAARGTDEVIVAMQFFLPGRHAGEGGDVESICQGVVERYPHLRVHITPLISEHPGLLDLLIQRMDR